MSYIKKRNLNLLVLKE